MFGLNLLFTLQGRRQARTDYGSVEAQEYTIAEHVPGALQEMPTPEKIARFGAADINAAKLWLEIEHPVTDQQWVKNEENGEVWRVVDVLDAAGREHHWEVAVERVD